MIITLPRFDERLTRQNAQMLIDKEHQYDVCFVSYTSLMKSRGGGGVFETWDIQWVGVNDSIFVNLAPMHILVNLSPWTIVHVNIVAVYKHEILAHFTCIVFLRMAASDYTCSIRIFWFYFTQTRRHKFVRADGQYVHILILNTTETKNRRGLRESEFGCNDIHKYWLANQICRTKIMFYV